MKFFLIFFSLFVLVIGVPERSWSQDVLNSSQISRVKTCVQLLRDVDQQDVEARRLELEKGRYTEERLVILEAVARTYAEVAKEQNVVTQEGKDWLYSIVTLNMGYLQLGGLKMNQRDSALNLRIRHKLKSYIPAHILANEDLFYPPDFMDQ